MIDSAKSPEHYDDAAHAYFIDAVQVPNVTFVIEDNDLIDTEYMTEKSRQRGKVVHHVLAGIAQGLTFRWEDLHEDLHGYVKSGMLWLERTQPKIISVERQVYSRLYGFAGTIDLECMIQDYTWIIDHKTSASADDCWRYQDAAYDLALGDPAPGIKRRRGCLMLKENGTVANLIPHNGPDHSHDGAEFLALLTATKIRLRAGKSQLPKGE